MVSANVKILQDLRCFLQLCSRQPQLRDHYSVEQKDFSRRRKLPFEKLATLIVNCLKRSLQVELREFFEMQGQLPCSKAAFCQQRQKLSPHFFYHWNQLLVQSFYHHYASAVQRWRGLRVLACDGSTVYLPQRPELAACFGTQANQHGAEVMARILQVEDVLNHLTLYGALRPITSSEQSVGYGLSDFLPPDSISLWDRAFGSYALMYLLQQQEQPRFFVIRAKTHHGFKEVEAFLKSALTTKTTVFYPSEKSIKVLEQHGYKVTAQTPLQVRMCKVELEGGQTEVLLTNLLNEDLYPLKDLKYLYGLRWRIEVKYFKQKNTLQLEHFSGYSPQAILQDYLASLLVMNLESLIEKQSEAWLSLCAERRKLSWQINGNAAVAALKHRIVQLLLPEYSLITLLVQLQIQFEHYIEPLRPHRSFARKKKSRRLNGKFQTFTNFKHNL
jgi:hypothetical protein